MSFVPSILWENICSLPAGFPRLPFPALGGEHHCLRSFLAASPWLWTQQAGPALHPVTRRPWQSPGQAPTLPSLLPTIWPMLLGWTQVPMGRESVPGLASSGRGSCGLVLGCQGLVNCCQSKHHPLPASSGPLDQEGKVEENRGTEPRLRTRALVDTVAKFHRLRALLSYLQKRKWRLREEKDLAQGHTAQEVARAGFEPRTQSQMPLKAAFSLFGVWGQPDQG